MDYYKKFQVENKNNAIKQLLAQLESFGFNPTIIKNELEQINNSIDYDNNSQDPLRDEKFQSQVLLLEELEKATREFVGYFDILKVLKKLPNIKDVNTKVIMLLESIKKYKNLFYFGYVESHEEIYETLYSVIKEEFKKSSDSVLYDNLYSIGFGVEEINKSLFNNLNSFKYDSDVAQILFLLNKKQVFDNKEINKKLFKIITFIESGNKRIIDREIEDLEDIINTQSELKVKAKKINKDYKKSKISFYGGLLTVLLSSTLTFAISKKIVTEETKSIYEMVEKTRPDEIKEIKEKGEKKLEFELNVEAFIFTIFIFEPLFYIIDLIFEYTNFRVPLGWLWNGYKLNSLMTNTLNELRNNKAALKEVRELIEKEENKKKELEILELKIQQYKEIKKKYFSIRESELTQTEKENIESLDQLVDITSDLVEIMLGNKKESKKDLNISSSQYEQTFSSLLREEANEKNQNNSKAASLMNNIINSFLEIEKLSQENQKMFLHAFNVPIDTLIINVNGHKEFNPRFRPFLKYINLITLNCENLNVSHLDLSETNIIIDPQTVYNKDLSFSKFSYYNVSEVAVLEGCNTQNTEIVDQATILNDYDWLTTVSNNVNMVSSSK